MPTARRVALVYWLLDCSGSMSGEKIATLNMAMGESLLSLARLGAPTSGHVRTSSRHGVRENGQLDDAVTGPR